METADCVKCIACLCKILKIVKCVKKAEICIIVTAMVLVGIGAACDNKKEIGKLVKKMKKKVM